MASEVTKKTNLIIPQVMGDMINAKLEAMLRITPYARVDTTLQGVPGDTKTVPSWNYVGDAVDVAEGGEVETRKLTSASTTFTIKKAMQSVAITQEAVNSGLGNPIGQAELQLAKAIQGKVESDLLEAALTSGNVYDGTSAVLKYSAIVDAVDVFGEEEITDKVMFVAPAQVTTLRKDSDFIDKTKYGNEVMISGEIGMVAGVRIVPSKRVRKIAYTKDNENGTITIVADTTAESATAKHLATVQPACVETLAVGDKVKAVTAAYYRNPLIKLEPASADTEYTEDELPALTIFLKADTTVDAEWFPKKQQTDITAVKYYGTALTNAAKVVIAKIKA